jgi:hypothetical protein
MFCIVAFVDNSDPVDTLAAITVGAFTIPLTAKVALDMDVNTPVPVDTFGVLIDTVFTFVDNNKGVVTPPETTTALVFAVVTSTLFTVPDVVVTFGTFIDPVARDGAVSEPTFNVLDVAEVNTPFTTVNPVAIADPVLILE